MLVGCDTDGTSSQSSSLGALKDLPSRTVVVDSPEAIFNLFNELHYTHEEWQAGNLSVPRIYMAGIPARWQKTSNNLTVVQKKALFFRLLCPLVLHANELIAQDRARLKELGDAFAGVQESDQQWLLGLALRYKVIKAEATSLSPEQIKELRLRVDVIPVSLALAQGAEESGWGTSRFAVLGNALFGQWDFSGKGIKPERQRKELGNYGLARFDTPLDSVVAYMLNLNTHNAYRALRIYRAQLRAKSKALTGFELAKKLDKYSERGQKYVDGLHSLMRINGLAPTDEARLTNDEVIYLVHELDLKK